MTTISKARRMTTVLLSALVAVLAGAVFKQAFAVVEGPNALLVNYSIAPGANSTAITIAENESVFVMGCQTAVGYRGIGSVSMLHIPGSFLEWVGLESPTPSSITSGFSGVAGTHVVYLDYSHLVDIEVHSPDTFVVQNSASSPITATGSVTIIW
jgi:hypothetical protein